MLRKPLQVSDHWATSEKWSPIAFPTPGACLTQHMYKQAHAMHMHTVHIYRSTHMHTNLLCACISLSQHLAKGFHFFASYRAFLGVFSFSVGSNSWDKIGLSLLWESSEIQNMVKDSCLWGRDHAAWQKYMKTWLFNLLEAWAASLVCWQWVSSTRTAILVCFVYGGI